MRTVLMIGVLACSLMGCGDAQGTDPEPDPDVAAGRAAVRLVDRADADLLLYVSNQSFEDEEVHLTVAVDGVTVVDDEFHVEGQHNWITFPLALEAGEHEITAESDSGGTLRESFTVPEGKMRYAVLDHWTEAGSAELTWRFSREPVAFA